MAQSWKFGAMAVLAGIGVCLAVPAQAQFVSAAPGPGGFYFGPQGGWTHLDLATNTGECGGGCIPPFPGAQATSHEEAGSLADAARDLRRLTLEKFPRAMSFIRPGFDEPWRCAPPSPSPELASRESAAR